MSEKNEFSDIFDYDFDAENEWRGMPEFNQPDNSAYRQIIVSFKSEDDVAAFFKLLDRSYSEKTKSVWFPDKEGNVLYDLFYFDELTAPDDIEER